ncbi:LysM peptidoglycan-binding domain-containing protein [Bacillus mojavensis]|uniref:LysM peptidoglycan-binding domain-containing protein n=1 Tax=Bacillus mojavensis TaxID=72360 RepID=UPI002DB6062C|nr:LysM peptidoglycan-binding domain-containing protein [Bacillus mojavensis]MEC1735685.1 LysM peptidoglycan-binding domain-containing protein [Bacillus mojavensis]MEC1794363.1 LysM peptidoglycan-binding domain-containing protein [Bacillus mojavensis]
MNLPQNHRLQFSVEETICFQKGQEVSELLSISLDPDIRVQEVNDYVSIRGSLELTGEYNIDQSKNAEEFYTDKRFVEEVRTREDGTAELTHCFPVDITIPKNKVSHLHEVFVFIDAFDYQLTNSRILTIQADLAIEGLLDDTANREPDIPLYEAHSEGFSEPPEFLVSEAEPFALEAENSEDSKTEEAPAEVPELHVSEAGFREEQENEEEEAEQSKPSALEDSEEIKANEVPAGAPELHVSEAGFREEQKNEEEEAERSEPFALEADSEEIKANEAPAGAPELHVSEAGLREEQEHEEEEAERSEPFALKDSEEIKANEAPAEAPELLVSKAGLREEHASQEKETVRSESPLEPEGSEDINAAEAKQPELILSEAGLREEVETIEAAKAASGREIREKAETEEEQAELSDPLVLETEKSPAAEAERGEEKIEKSDSPILEHARRQESQETESELSDHIEPALRQDAEQLEEVRETVPENVVSLEEESREQEKVPAAPLKEAAAAPTLHFNQKISAEEESQEEELTPAYRTFLPEQDSEEHSFYSAPKLLEEEEEKEESFEIEVRKTPSPEEPEEETSFHSYQLPDTSDPERKETDAVARDVPAAQTKEPETKENHNSLYLTKLFTREEDEFSRMKICIVQQEDTIERLCERYDITSQQLIRMNSLALDDELKAGQILYIPQYKSSHA